MSLWAAFRWTAWKGNILQLQSTIQGPRWVEAVSAPQSSWLFSPSSFARSIYLHLCRLDPIYWPLHLSTVFNAFLPSHSEALPNACLTTHPSAFAAVIQAHFAAARGTDGSRLVSARTDYSWRRLIKLPNFVTVFSPTCRRCDLILFAVKLPTSSFYLIRVSTKLLCGFSSFSNLFHKQKLVLQSIS